MGLFDMLWNTLLLAVLCVSPDGRNAISFEGGALLVFRKAE